MDLRSKISDVREWISDNIDDPKVMIGVTLILGIIGAFTGNAVFLALALLPAYRLGRLEGEGGIICEECGDSLEESYESSRDHTENRVRLVDQLRSKD